MQKNNFSILYVEDDCIIKEQYVKLLQLYFKNVYEATDGKEALALYALHDPDIVILDINIPKIDGLKVAKKIREENPNTLLIMLTAYSDTQKLLDAIELNITKYMIKPVKTFELENLLKGLIVKLNNKYNNTNLLYLEGGFFWNKQQKQLYDHNKQEVKLTKKEYLLLELFCTHPSSLFSNEMILSYVWEAQEGDLNANKLRIVFSKLKTKLSCNLFISFYNIGYKLKRNN